MEKSKYLPPKFSYAFKDLAETYNVFEKENSAFGSDYESDFSVGSNYLNSSSKYRRACFLVPLRARKSSLPT